MIFSLALSSVYTSVMTHISFLKLYFFEAKSLVEGTDVQQNYDSVAKSASELGFLQTESGTPTINCRCTPVQLGSAMLVGFWPHNQYLP